MLTFWDRKEKKWVALLSSLPFFWILYSLLGGRYFPDPAEPVMTLSGIWASIFLIMTLSLSPLVKLSYFKVLGRYRRFFGLCAFWYSFLHLMAYLVLHAGFSWEWIRDDLTEKPYIYIGVFAFTIFLLLGLTSFKAAIRKLGKNWKRLHRMVYLAALAVLLHLWWQVKSDESIAVYISLFVFPLLAFRLGGLRKYIVKKVLAIKKRGGIIRTH